MDSYDRKRLAVIGRATEMLAAYPRILAFRAQPRRCEGLRRLLAQTRALRSELAAALDLFAVRPYRSLLGQEIGSKGEAADAFRMALIRRFEGVIAKDTQACIDKLDELARRCAAKLRQLEGV